MLPKDLAKGRSWEPWKIFPKIMISEFFSKVQGLLGGTNGDNIGHNQLSSDMADSTLLQGIFNKDVWALYIF